MPLNNNIQAGKVLLDDADQLALMRMYQDKYGAPTDDEASTQKMQNLVSGYVNWKNQKLATEADEKIKTISSSSATDPINQMKGIMSKDYQNSLQYKYGVPKANLSEDEPISLIQPEKINYEQLRKEEAVAKEKNKAKKRELTLGGTAVQEMYDEPETLTEKYMPSVDYYLNKFGTHAAAGLSTVVGDIVSGKVFNFIPIVDFALQRDALEKKKAGSKELPGATYFSPMAAITSGGKSWFSTPESREKVFQAFDDIGKNEVARNTATKEQYKQYGLNETGSNVAGTLGDLSLFFMPGLGEEAMATRFSSLLQSPTKVKRMLGSLAAMAPKVIPLIHSHSLSRGEELGLQGAELNDFATRNTLLNAATYAVIPNAITQHLNPGYLQGLTKLVTEPSRQGLVKSLAGIMQRAGMSGLAGTTAAAEEMALSNAYAPESQKVDLTSEEAMKQLKTAFITNALIHTAVESKNILNSFKPVNPKYTKLVYDLAADYDNSVKSINDEFERSKKTDKDAKMRDTAISVLTKIKPYVGPGMAVKDNLQGLYAFNMAKMEDLVNKRNTIDPANVDEIAKVTNEIDKTKYAIDQLLNNKYTRGRLISPVEVIKMGDENTPGRLKPLQVMQMADNFGFKSDFVDPTLYKDDPEVQAHLEQLRTGQVAPLPENTNPIVVNGDGRIIDGKKRVAQALYDIEKGTYKLKDASGNKLEVMRPLSSSEIGDNIYDLSLLSPTKRTGLFFKSKKLALSPEDKKTYGLKEEEGSDGIPIGEAINQVYHNARQEALDKALGEEKITRENVLGEEITGQIDGQKAEDVVKDLLANTAHMEDDARNSAIDNFVNKVNEQKTANVNPNINAFVKTAEFMRRAGVREDDLSLALAESLGVDQRYTEGYLKKLRKDGKLTSVNTEELFTPTDVKIAKAKAANVQAVEPAVQTVDETVKPTTPVPAVVAEGEVKTPTRVVDIVDSKVEYQGKKGRLTVDEENNVVFDDGRREYLLGKTTDPEFANKTAEELGITSIEPLQKGVTVDGDNITVDGESQTLVSVNKNLDGDVVSYTYKTADGKLRTSRNVEVAQEINKQQLLKSIDAQEFTPEQVKEAEDAVNEAFVEEHGGAAMKIIDEMPEDVADAFANMMAGLKTVAPNELQQMVVRASEWVDEAKAKIDESKAPEAEKQKAKRMLDLFDNDLTKYYEKLEKQRLSKANVAAERKAAESAGQNQPSAEGKQEPTAEPTVTITEVENKPVDVDESDVATESLPMGESDTIETENPVVASKEEVEFAPITDKEKKSRFNEIVAKGNTENLRKLFDRLSEIKDEDGLPLLERDPNNPKECP